MALLSVRTKVIISLVIVNIVGGNYGDSVSVRQNNYGLNDDIRISDPLLRGRDEYIPEVGEEDISIPNINTDRIVEPERIFPVIENTNTEQKERNLFENDYDINVPNPILVLENRNIDISPKYDTTESAPQMTASLENGSVRLRNKDFKNFDDDSFPLIHNHSLDGQNDGDIGTENSITSLETTETIIDLTSPVNNNIYRRRDSSVTDDLYTNITQNYYDTVSKIDSIIPTQATPSEDDEDLSFQKTDDLGDKDVTGQRNPKTENSETKPIVDRKINEVKAQVPIAVSKSSTLKGWLEDIWLRPPAGILVPLRPMALNRALAVWNDLVAVEGVNVSDIIILGYDSNGVTWRSRHNLHSTTSGPGDRIVSEALSKLLLKYQGVHIDESGDGTMRALASAAKVVPYDSALFVVTDKGAGDPQRLPLALRALVEKRLKVYTIWTDPNHPSTESDLALQELKNVSTHTEGDILPYSLEVMDVDDRSNSAELQQWLPLESVPVPARRARIYSQTEPDYDTLLVWRGGGGAISLGVPVENGVTALRVHIEGAVELAVLYPPNDAPQIDLYNETSIRIFSPNSKINGLSPRDIYLGFLGADPDDDMLTVVPVATETESQASTVGVWHLSVRCDTCDYRLCLSARTRIHFDTELKSDKLELRVTGPVASVRESLLVDEHGNELTKLPFSYQPLTGDTQVDASNGLDTELVSDVPMPKVTASKVYAKIVGRDIQGEPFVRLSGPLNQQAEVRLSRSASISFPDSMNDLELAEEENFKEYNGKLQYNDTNVLPSNRASSQIVNQQGAILTAVQIGLSSRLYGSPGDTLQLHFEVTNYRNQAERFTFEAVGELRFLRGITPTAQTITSGQTVNVIVQVGITASAQPGARDLITFTAYTGNLAQVSISVYVYVVNSDYNVADVWPPELRHNFQGSCMGRMGSDCATHTWSATVIARDSLGGLLRLSSSPIGLLYESNFIAGSRDEVTATYRANCCAPRVVVTAVDAYGNANSYIVDISGYFTQSAIAAIVLGVILAIMLLVLIAFLIYWCVRRRKESRELPTYTTSRTTRSIS